MGLLIDLDVDSFQNVSSHSPQVMVYGFGYCKHLQLIYTLHTMQPPIVNKVFECSIGNTYKVPDQLFDDKLRTTIEGRLIKQFVAEPLDNGTDEKLLAKKYCTRVYKTGILNLVFENFLRKENGLPIIPLIFTIDINNIKFPYDPASFATDTSSKNSTTKSEIRRCYKLACEFPDPRIREISKETFRFVQVKIVDNKHYIELKDPFWLEPAWKEAWRSHDSRGCSHKLFKEHSWEEQLLNAIRIEDDNRIAPSK